MVQVLIMMADYGHDPTETAIPYHAFKNAGFHVHFATETGNTPACDNRMTESIFPRLILGAKKSTAELYKKMTQTPEWVLPRSWTASAFTLAPFDLVLLPGGHDESVRQLVDSTAVHRLLADFFPRARKPGRKAVAAVCRGVVALSASRDDRGRSILADCVTTTLPAAVEQAVSCASRALISVPYRTYHHTDGLDTETLLKISLSLSSFVVEDDQYNYVSARSARDVDLMARKVIELMDTIDHPEYDMEILA